MTSNVEERLLALGLSLPTIVPPRGSFLPYVMSGSLLYLSGKGAPLRSDGEPVPKVGAEVSVAQARAHARSAIGVASLPKGFAVEIEAIVEFA
jgi:hypothetical protein